MKLVEFKEFARLPEGTIFSYYEPAIFIGLWCKGQTIYGDPMPGVPENIRLPIDYFQRSLLPFQVDGNPPEIGGTERWGEFAYEQEYAVYEAADLKILHSLAFAAMLVGGQG